MQSWSESALRKLRQGRMVMLMKGHGVDRGADIPSAAGRDVNSGLRAIEPAAIGSCQQRVDTKAFMGRGNRHELRQRQAEIDTLIQRMRALSDASKQIAGLQIYLMLHQRHSTGYVFLRWREAGSRKRHLSWEEGEALFQRYVEPLRSWYAQLAQHARQVNADLVQARRRARQLRAGMAASETPIFARPLSDGGGELL